MGKKYIIELLDDCTSEFKGIMVFGVTQEKQISVELIPEESLRPYTEPDLEQVRKEAYQQGLNDARERKATCEFCEYEMRSDRDEPCRICACNYTNFFEPKKQDKEKIKVGDEVSLKSGGRGFVTRIIILDNEQKSAYVVWSDGYVGNYDLDVLQKTGKHYSDVVEVLQRMKEADNG